METFFIKATQLILAFAILVIIHEFGHYIFARFFGIKVEKFCLFFDPWFTPYTYKPKRKDDGQDPNADGYRPTWRDTAYGIGWLPLGGYVKIAGMIDESMDTEQLKQPAKSWEFRSKPAWQRLLVMVAGVLFNFILAIIIYSGLAYTQGEAYINFTDATLGMEYCETAQKAGFVDGDIPLTADGAAITHETNMLDIIGAKQVTVLRSGTDTVAIDLPSDFVLQVNSEIEKTRGQVMAFAVPVVVNQAINGEGAAHAGLKRGDRITSVNGAEAQSFTRFTGALAKNSGKTVQLGFIRDGKPLTADVEVNENGKIGVQLTPINEIYPVQYKQYSLLQSIPQGCKMGVEKLTSYIGQFKYVFTSEGAKSIGGFGAIGSIFPESWNWIAFWNITAFLSVILAFMNILPIPALDGGHVLFLLYEVITRREPNQKFLEYAQIAGMVFLIGLLIYANGNDIYRFFIK